MVLNSYPKFYGYGWIATDFKEDIFKRFLTYRSILVSSEVILLFHLGNTKIGHTEYFDH